MKKAATGVIVLIAIFVIWTVFRTSVSSMMCSRSNVKDIELSSLRFEIEDMNCDGLAKDDAIRVYAKDTALNGRWFFSKWRNQRTLLFRYDPGRPDNPLPSITRPNSSTILISVPEVSSIEYQNRNWANMSVHYEIGRVDFPSTSK
jgi:hypothetical protein